MAKRRSSIARTAGVEYATRIWSATQWASARKKPTTLVPGDRTTRRPGVRQWTSPTKREEMPDWTTTYGTARFATKTMPCLSIWKSICIARHTETNANAQIQRRSPTRRISAGTAKSAIPHICDPRPASEIARSHTYRNV